MDAVVETLSIVLFFAVYYIFLRWIAPKTGAPT
ncbi:MAG: hypothetical protein MAGBODY4_00919 [Candidatus Marinimicrobia bacterium]|nr:hypothetical protein [Candidatus Neomarinimicrobiota bacterium]